MLVYNIYLTQSYTSTYKILNFIIFSCKYISRIILLCLFFESLKIKFGIVPIFHHSHFFFYSKHHRPYQFSTYRFLIELISDQIDSSTLLDEVNSKSQFVWLGPLLSSMYFFYLLFTEYTYLIHWIHLFNANFYFNYLFSRIPLWTTFLLCLLKLFFLLLLIFISLFILNACNS